MPAEVFATTNAFGSKYDIVPPGYSTPLEIYDSRHDIEGFLVVSCDKADAVTKLFLFPQPEAPGDAVADVRNADPARLGELLALCDEDSLIKTLLHDRFYPVDTHSRDHQPVRIVVAHRVTMTDN